MSSDILGRVTKDGSSGYKAEKGRYHLYVSHGCPYAHRCTIARLVKGLEDVISMDNVDYVLNREIGWKFSPDKEGCDPDTVNGKEYLKEVYLMSHPEYNGRITVPVLFDKQSKKIVSNSSADILRMLGSEFNEFCAIPGQAAIDFYPEEKRKEIGELEEWITSKILNGVFRVAYAAKEENQEAYNEAIESLFSGYDKVEEILSSRRYLTGDMLTEIDIKLFVILARFDSVYYTLYKCSKKPLILYKNIWPYMRDIYQMNISSTVYIEQSKVLAFKSTRFSSNGGELLVKITGKKQFSIDNPQGGMELPALYIFKSTNSEAHSKLPSLVSKALKEYNDSNKDVKNTKKQEEEIASEFVKIYLDKNYF